MDEVLPGKEGVSKSLKKYLKVGILFLIIIICVFLIYFNFNNKNQLVLSCGDGTFYNNCSVTKPYYCQEGILIENVSVCECPLNYSLEGGNCISVYHTNSSNFDLEFILNGELKYLNFIFYEGILEYVMDLPRYLKYTDGEEPVRADFKLMKINDPIQRESLMPLVVEIQNLAPWSKDEQAQIAVSIVQNIPYGEPDPVAVFMGIGKSRLSRHPYQTLYENTGSCEDKSELLASLLRELGFEVVLFYYQKENHEAVGIKCPVKYSLNNTGYCFVETTLAGPISYSEGRYLGPGGNTKLGDYTEIIKISDGISLRNNLDDYSDAKVLARLVNKIDKKGYLNYFEKRNLDELREKYGLIY